MALETMRLWKRQAGCLPREQRLRADLEVGIHLPGAPRPEWVATKAGAAASTRLVRPIGVVLEYFSKMALSAYFAHLWLLYGFWGIQFTQVWHRKSNWYEYWWRLGVVWCLTALVCYGLHRCGEGSSG